MAVSRAFSLITFPLIARHLSVSEYGMLDLFLVLANLIVTTMIFGQDSAVGRFFYEYDNQNQRRQIISQSLLIQAVCCIAALLILFLLSGRVAGYISSNENSIRYLNIVLLQLPFTLAVNFAQNMLKWTFARLAFLIMTIGYSALQAAGLVVMRLYFQITIENVLIVNLCANILFGLLGLYMIRHWLVLPQRMNYTHELLRFGLPFGFVCLMGAMVPMLERQLVQKILSFEYLGLYAAGSKLAMLLALVMGAFQTAWGPFATAIHREVDATQTYNFVLGAFSLLVCVLALLLDSVAIPLIELLATPYYVGAAVVVLPLAMALVVQSIGWVTEIGISLSKRTSNSVYSYLIYITTVVVAMMTLIPLLGLVGAALAILLAQMLRSLFASWLAQRVYPIPWNYGWVLKVVLCTLLAGFLAHSLIAPLVGRWSVTPFYLVVSVGLSLYFWRWQVDQSTKTRLAAKLGLLNK